VRHSPLDRHGQLVDSGAFSSDPHQLVAVRALDALWHELLRQRQRPLLGRIGRRKPVPVRGLYLWGDVGRGKTWLMDLFFDCLPTGRKQRMHFHRFMQRVHRSLAELGRARDPLARIGADWATQAHVLCLDEFFVADIADAMLLAGLLDSLFAHGVTLVTTSNARPDDLYRDGLQRAKFLPAIELLKQRTHVLNIAGDTAIFTRAGAATALSGSNSKNSAKNRAEPSTTSRSRAPSTPWWSVTRPGFRTRTPAQYDASSRW
jgi:cell division protein ZapE